MNRRAFGHALAAIAGSCCAFGGRTALAAGLTDDERKALSDGKVVRRPVDTELEEGIYLGGVSYAVVQTPAAFVLDMLRDVSVYKLILPFTLAADPRGKKGDDQLVYFKHGGKLGTAGYVMRIRPADADGVIRFWMDPAFDHEIEDVWGYVRAEPLGPETCLATYAVLFDPGTLTRIAFGERIRELALDTPGNIQTVAESRRRSGAAQSVLVP